MIYLVIIDLLQLFPWGKCFFYLLHPVSLTQLRVEVGSEWVLQGLGCWTRLVGMWALSGQSEKVPERTSPDPTWVPSSNWLLVCWFGGCQNSTPLGLSPPPSSCLTLQLRTSHSETEYPASTFHSEPLVPWGSSSAEARQRCNQVWASSSVLGMWSRSDNDLIGWRIPALASVGCWRGTGSGRILSEW